MPHTTISVPRLHEQVNGRVITPDDPGYDQARQVFYGGFDRHPQVIVQAADADDVATVVTLARDSGQELAVRSGGHSPAGHGVLDGGIVLDLGALRALEIDAEARTAWAEPGLTAGEYTVAVAGRGLATGFGDTGSVGIGGITLAGGVGYLVRKHGLTIDDLLAQPWDRAGGVGHGSLLCVAFGLGRSVWANHGSIGAVPGRPGRGLAAGTGRGEPGPPTRREPSTPPPHDDHGSLEASEDGSTWELDFDVTYTKVT